jgi:chromosome partitioning protein
LIIALVSQKGGVGKSALARVLAVEYVRAGWNVKIGDLDTKQGTATRWKVRRDQANIQPEIPVEKYATIDRAVRDATGFDLMILDGPAHAEKGGLAMAKAADLVLMPTGYGLDDLEAQVEAAYELEANKIDRQKIWFVFSKATGSAVEDEAARDYLRRANINFFASGLPELPSIRQAHNAGKCASEVSFSGVREGAMSLAVAIAEHLRGRKTEHKAEEAA